jgi:uncharacterized protein
MTGRDTDASTSSVPMKLEALVGGGTRIGLTQIDRRDPPHCGDIGLEIRADGTWWYQRSQIERPALVSLFASILRKDEDNKTYLVTPLEKILVSVADAPFLIVEMIVDGASTDPILRLRTNLDEWIAVGVDHPLRFVEQSPSGGLKPYVRVRGRLEALIARSVYLELVDLLDVSGDDGSYGLWSGGMRWKFDAAASTVAT